MVENDADERRDSGGQEDGEETDSVASAATVKAPDGGYGWIVCVCGFFCWFIGDGIAFSYGVFYVSLLEQFNEGPAATSWVGAAFVGGHNLMGPVAGALVKKIGCRATVIVGSLVATVGFILAMFSPNIITLALTYGAMGGSGLNFLLVASVEMVAKYFNKRRALANGVVTCGAGVGGFAIPLLLKILVDKYDWDGALLILAGISLNGCVLGALFRPLDTSRRFVAEVAPVGLECAGDKPENLCDGKAVIANGRSDGANSEISADFTNSNGSFKESHHSDRIVIDSIEVSVTESCPVTNAEGVRFSDPDKMRSDKVDSGVETSFLRKQNGGHLGESDSEIPVQNEICHLRPHGHIRTLNSDISSAVFIGSMASISGVDIQKPLQRRRRSSLAAVTSFCRSCPETFGFNLISTKPVFILFVLSCTFWTAQMTMFMYLVDYALTRDIDKTRGTILLSVIGILNTVGRVLIGLLTDYPRVDRYLLYGLSLVLAGVVNVVVPFTSEFGVLVACSAAFGLSQACFVSLRAILVVDLLGVDLMIRGFGLVLFSQGIGFLIGPPIAAAIYEYSGTYTGTFLSAGAFLFLAATSILPVRLLLRNQKCSSTT